MIAYLRVLVNPDDDISLRRIINEPKRSIGDTTVGALLDYTGKEDISLYAAVYSAEELELSSRAKTVVSRFGDLLMELQELHQELPADELLRKKKKKIGYEDQYTAIKSEENQNRLDNIKELEGALVEYVQLNPEGGLQGFLENVALVTDLDSMQNESKALTLMTLHSAKGLEFPVVFLVGMEEGIFPSNRSQQDEDRLEEERRLCYVGITRAMQSLYIACACNRAVFGMRQTNMPSRFLDEIPEQYKEEIAAKKPPARMPIPERPTVAVDSFGRTAQNKTKVSALGIEGLSKGFPGFVSSAARDTVPAILFELGDKVMHRMFGEGVVSEVQGSGREARLVIEFKVAGKKSFPAVTAPVVKLG